MTKERLIHELILTKAQLIHAMSSLRSRTWNDLQASVQDGYIDQARQAFEGQLLRKGLP